MSRKRERVKYTKGFKQDAENLVIEQGDSAVEVDRRLGIKQCDVSS